MRKELRPVLAPDMDSDVARQRMQVFGSDPDLLTHWSSQAIPPMLSGRLTVYSSPEDRALSVASFLFRSQSRVDQLSPEKTPLDTQEYVVWIFPEESRRTGSGRSCK